MGNGLEEWWDKYDKDRSKFISWDKFSIEARKSAQAAWDHQQKRIDELEEMLADREERLHKIYLWAEAYPLDVFPDATPEEIESIEPQLRARVHAKWARHIFSHLMKYSDTGQRP